MGSFLLFLLLIFAVILFMGIGFIMRFVRLFTKGPDTSGRRYTDDRNRNQNRNSNSNNSSTSSHSKVFGKDEGEYVDFEEIK